MNEQNDTSKLQRAFDDLAAEWEARSPWPEVDRYAAPDERRDVGRRIDPATAGVFFLYAQVLDPYGELDLSPEEDCVGRSWFAVDPVERVAVSFYDLPDETRELLRDKQGEADAEGWRQILECAALAKELDGDAGGGA